jgi:hypothetical protein
VIRNSFIIYTHRHLYHNLPRVLGGKKPVEVHAAVWVPDNEATICMHCNKTQFTVLNRRVIIDLAIDNLQLSNQLFQFFALASL